MKKVISVILISVLLIGLAIPAFAAEDVSVQPRYSYITYVATDISINQSTGIATCDGTILAQADLPVKVHVQLLVKKNGNWQALYTKVANDQRTARALFQFEVEKGYEYKVVTNAYVYNAQGNLLESTVCTDFASYPVS